MKEEIHTIYLPRRTATLTIVEEEKRVVMSVRFSKIGPSYGDSLLVADFLGRYMHRYDFDSRPLVIKNPHSGEVATISADGSTMLIEPGVSPN